jgi:hypothetical protein
VDKMLPRRGRRPHLPTQPQLTFAGATSGEIASAHGTALGWTAWGSREIPGAAGRQDAYVEAAKLLLAAGARVDQGMIGVASDTVAEVLEDAARKRPASD